MVSKKNRPAKEKLNRFHSWQKTQVSDYQITLILLKDCANTDLCRESTEKCKPEVAQRKRKVLVEEILEELAHANVGPSAVDEQQPLQEAELSECIVTGHHSLHAFLTTDANSDVGHCSNTQSCTNAAEFLSCVNFPTR